MKKKDLAVFGLSLLAHLLFYIILLLSQKLVLKSQPEDLHVEWVQLDDSQEPSEKGAFKNKIKNTIRKSKRGGSEKRGTINLDNLKPALYSMQYDESQSQSSLEHKGQWSDQPVMDTLNSMSLPEYSRNYYFFEILTQNMNQPIQYPKEYANNMLTGQFWIRIFIGSTRSTVADY